MRTKPYKLWDSFAGLRTTRLIVIYLYFNGKKKHYLKFIMKYKWMQYNGIINFKMNSKSTLI